MGNVIDAHSQGQEVHLLSPLHLPFYFGTYALQCVAKHTEDTHMRCLQKFLLHIIVFVSNFLEKYILLLLHGVIHKHDLAPLWKLAAVLSSPTLFLSLWLPLLSRSFSFPPYTSVCQDTFSPCLGSTLFDIGILLLRKRLQGQRTPSLFIKARLFWTLTSSSCR